MSVVIYIDLPDWIWVGWNWWEFLFHSGKGNKYMSVGNFFKAIGHGIEKVTTALQPFASAIPGPFGTVLNAIIAVEQLFPSGNGAVKKTTVSSIVQANFPQVDLTKLGSVVDQIVAALNSLGVLHSTTPMATSTTASSNSVTVTTV
jgi:hypothetical protein